MNRTVVAFYALLVSCVLGLSIFVSRSVGNIAVLAGYGVFLVSVVAANIDLSSRKHSLSEIEVPFQYHLSLLYPAIVLWGMFVVGFALNPSTRALLRLGAFTVLSAITLFVVPAIIPRERAFRAIGVLGAALFAIGLPTVALGDYAIFGLRLGQEAGIYWITSDIGYWVPATIFDSVKYIRVLVAFGVVCSGVLYARTRNMWMGVVLALNLLGVILTTGRAAILAVLVAGLLFAVYQLGGRRAVAGVTLAGMIAVVLVIAVIFEILPGPAALVRSMLGKRTVYWTASYQAFAARPILGWGLADTTAVVSDYYSLGDGSLTGTHNSYLRLFVSGGIVGGISYLILSASAIVLAFRSIREHALFGLATYCLVVMALTFQLFDGATIFGTGFSSVLWALAIGYAQPGVTAAD